MNIKLLIASLILSTVVACSSSPLGRTQITMMSAEKMNELGAQSFEEIKKKETISTNTAVNAYVQCIADNITRNVSKDVHSGDWEVVVFQSDQVNAFALPGGKIGVYTGIIKVAETQDQLAAVMGHEVGHVIAEHSNERMSSNNLVSGSLAAVNTVLGAFDVQSKDLIVQGLGLGAQYGVLMPYGRAHEKEADIIGQNLMAVSGFNPTASVDLWRNMAKASGGSPPEFMSTHPAHDTRIRELSDHLSETKPSYNSSKQNPQCARPRSI